MKKMIITLLIATVVFSSFMTAAAYADTTNNDIIHIERQLLAADASLYTNDNVPGYELFAFLKFVTDSKTYYDWYKLDESFDMTYNNGDYLISMSAAEDIINYFVNDHFLLFNGCGIGGTIPYVVIDKESNVIALNPEIDFINIGGKFYIKTTDLEKHFGLKFEQAGNNLIISMPVKFETHLKGF